MAKLLNETYMHTSEDDAQLLCYSEKLYETIKIEDRITPMFYSTAEATYGKQGVTMPVNPGLCGITGPSTVAPGLNQNVAFDLGEGTIEAYKITYIPVVAGGSYPALVLKNLEGSSDGETWTFLYSFVGDRNNGTISIPTPNNFRYIRFMTYNDHTAFGGCGCREFKIYFRRKVLKDRLKEKPSEQCIEKQEHIYYTPATTDLYAWAPDKTKEWVLPVFSANTLATKDNYYTLSASHTSGSYYPYKSFDGNTTTGDDVWWTGDIGVSISNAPWIMLRSHYKPLYLTEVSILNEHVSPHNYVEGEVQVSNDGETWKTVSKLTPGINEAVTITTSWDLDKPYYYYRLRFTKSFTAGITMQNVVFKGFDVTTQQRRPL